MSDHKPAGDKQGVNILNAFQLHQLSLKRFIGRYLNNAQDIEDVTQEAFLRAYKAERSTDVRQPKSFLFRIAKNVAISQLRSKSRQITDYIEDQPSADVLLSEWSTEDEVMAQQKLGIHCEAVAALPPKCRRVYLMRKVYGMPHKEIAQRLGIAASTVEKHLMKGVEACDRFIQQRTAEQPEKHSPEQGAADDRQQNTEQNHSYNHNHNHNHNKEPNPVSPPKPSVQANQRGQQ